jgi:hypothetical protein
MFKKINLKSTFFFISKYLRPINKKIPKKYLSRFPKVEYPSDIPLNSKKGRKMFKYSLKAGTLEPFFPLMEQIIT